MGILPDFIIIPSVILTDPKVSPLGGNVYGLIYWYTKLKLQKCTASNNTLAELLHSNPRSIQRALQELKERGYVNVVMDDKKHRVEIIPLVVFDLRPNGHTPHDETDVPPRPNRHHNKKSKEEELKKSIPNGIQAKPVVTYGNQEINEASKYLLEKLELPKEGCPQEQSRRYWHLLLKQSKTGLEGVKWLIDLTAADSWYCNNIASSKDLYYKATNILQRTRGKRPRIAVQGGVS